MTEQPTNPDPPTPDEPPDVTAIKTELDGALLDALRRATTRAEHVRLTRIVGLVRTLMPLAERNVGSTGS